MTVDELGKQMTEYNMRVEEVLSGMDTVLTRFDARLNNLENRFASQGQSGDSSQRIAQLELQVAKLTEALQDLLDEFDHD